MSEMAENHQFDRRQSDVNMRSLATQLKALENHVHETMTPELRANTRLTRQVHEAFFGKEGDDGMHAKVEAMTEALSGRGDEPGLESKVDSMYEIFAAARNGLRMLSAIANFCVRAIEMLGRVAKPLLFIAALCAAVITYSRTGAWTMPDWWTALLKALGP
jgi:hypothetical protein